MYIGNIDDIPGAVGAIIFQGALSKRPNAGYPNTLFLATDTHQLFRDTGVEWEIISGEHGLLEGGTLTSALYLPADPTTNLEAATKQYVDTQITSINAGTIFTAGNGLTLTNNSLDIVGSPRITSNANNIDLAVVTGLTAGTYNSVTVDTYGRVTSASNVVAGSSSWNVVTSAYTAVNGDRILADTSSAAFTITLPASPSVGQQVTITDAGRSFSTNNLTVNGNGSKILGVAQNLILDVAYQCTTLVYYNSTHGWVFGN